MYARAFSIVCRLFILATIANLVSAAQAQFSAQAENGKTTLALLRRNQTFHVCPEIEPPPKDFICGELGYRKDPKKTVYYPLQGSFDECRFQCVTHGACLSFEMVQDGTGTTCNLLSANLTRENYLVRKEGTHSWSRYCWNCSSHCPVANGVNVLKNSGFETGSISPWEVEDVRSSSATVVSPGSNSNYSLQISTTDDDGGIDLKQNLFTCPNTLYLFSFDIKVIFPHAAGGYFYNVETVAGNLEITLYGVPTNNTWKTFAGFFYPSFKDLFFAVAPPTNRTFFVDNIKATSYHSSLQPSIEGEELITNGGFETGKPAPWTLEFPDSHGGLVSPGINSTYGIAVAGGRVDLYQNITVKPGKFYLFTMDYSTLRGIGCSLTILKTPEFGAPRDGEITIDLESPQHDGQFKMPFLPLATGTIYISCIALNYPYTKILIDNISVKELAV